MLDNKGFNLWADGYDKSVNLSEKNNVYPFAGYKKVLSSIYNTIKKSKENKILDIGFGTGVLTKKLYDDGYSIFGIDFSEKMIEISKEKMPNAKLFQWDFTNGLPKELENEKFDFIIMTYSIHHIEDNKKIEFIKEVLNYLEDEGLIIIGDVAFIDKKSLEECRELELDSWDEDEFYPVLELLKPHFPNIEFEKISYCSGVFTIRKAA